MADSELTYFTDTATYPRILGRRKWSFIIPFLLITGIGAAFAFLLPPVFKSESTILIERQLIPKELVKTTVSGYIQEQIETIRQRIATSATLRDLSKQYNLKQELFETDPTEATREIRRAIGVRMVDVKAADPDFSGERRATVAFTVSFESENAETAQDVTNWLAKRYLEEHKLIRAERSAAVTEFLELEADSVKEELDAMEAELAKFKQSEFRQLPELMQTNLNLFEKTQANIEATETRIRQLKDRIESTEADVLLTEPYLEVQREDGTRLQSADDRLSSLTAQYLRLTTTYSAKHPDVIKMGREIRILAEQTGNAARADEILKQLTISQDELRKARQQYVAGHPEVVGLEKSVAALQRGLTSAIITNQPNKIAETVAPDNPRYVTLKSRLRTYRSDLGAEQEKLTNLNERLVEYEDRLFQTPVVDGDLASFQFDYDNARSKWRELTRSIRKAKLAEQLEEGQNAERLVLNGSASLPTQPESPNRIAILALGVMLAGLVGLIAVALAEYLDKTIHGARTVVQSLGAPPLAIIPVIPGSGQPTAHRASPIRTLPA